jgi:hypothetical protein
MISFKIFYEQCNVCANELEPGDYVENINPDCDHYKSKGIVIGIKTLPQDNKRTAGKLIVYKVQNNSSNFKKKEVNGSFGEGDELEKTEIQLRKIKGPR